MDLEPLDLPGVYRLNSIPSADHRGGFRRIADMSMLAEGGLEATVSQVSIATNFLAGTIRGLHYQAKPDSECKILWCSTGAIFDVLVDLREDERTYGKWIGVALDADSNSALYVPKGIAHGYQTLTDETAVTYLITTSFSSESARSLRWDDSTLAINWPLPVTALSMRDQEAPSWPPEH